MSRPKRTTHKHPGKNTAVPSHPKWPGKRHVVFSPKYRRKTRFGVVRGKLGPVFGALAEQKEGRVEEGHILAGHVHRLLSIPPKLAVSSVGGFLKGKSAIHVARHCLKRERHYAGQPLWARGFFVDTVGRDPETIRRYLQAQEATDQRLDQLELPIHAENQEANPPRKTKPTTRRFERLTPSKPPALPVDIYLTEHRLLPLQRHHLMGTIIIGVIAVLLLVYLFATMIYPEKF